MEQNSVKVANKPQAASKESAKRQKQSPALPLTFRKERKYAITQVNINVVENYVRSHPAFFSEPFPPRYINNIYFDTPKFQNYSDNVVGSMKRKKFRIRWYGDQFGYVQKPVLEIKIKEGLAGAKRRYPLKPFTLKEGFSITDIQNIVNESDVPPEIKDAMQFFIPTLLNRYHRKYFLTADKKFRLTLDTQLRFTKIAERKNYFMRTVTDHKKVVMEVKYDIMFDDEVNRISGYFPFRMTKNSKYVNGMDRLDMW